MKSRPNRVRFSEILHLNLATAGTRYHQGWYVAGKKTEHHCCCPLQDACQTPTARKSWRLRSGGHRPGLICTTCCVFATCSELTMGPTWRHERSFPKVPAMLWCCEQAKFMLDTSALPKRWRWLLLVDHPMKNPRTLEGFFPDSFYLILHTESLHNHATMILKGQ